MNKFNAVAKNTARTLLVSAGLSYLHNIGVMTNSMLIILKID